MFYLFIYLFFVDVGTLLIQTEIIFIFITNVDISLPMRLS